MTPRDCRSTSQRPKIHILASESDFVAELALSAELRHPVVAAMLLGEIERAELHAPETMPKGHVALGSRVAFVDEKTGKERTVQLVMPAEASIEYGRISILTPMGAALYGLGTGECIDWPDLSGHERRITIVRVDPAI